MYSGKFDMGKQFSDYIMLFTEL